jgi:hypothetical protein
VWEKRKNIFIVPVYRNVHGFTSLRHQIDLGALVMKKYHEQLVNNRIRISINILANIKALDNTSAMGIQIRCTKHASYSQKSGSPQGFLDICPLN